MSEVGGLTVTDKNGLRGQVRPEAVPLAQDARYLPVSLADGREVLAPVEALVERQDGSYFLPLSLTELGPSSENRLEPVEAQSGGLRSLAPEGASVIKSAREREEVIDEWVLQETVNVELVPVNRPVAEPVPVRYEGGTVIIPLHEEVLVVEKRLMLKEELRITRRGTPSRETQTIRLRREAVRVEDEEGRVLDLESDDELSAEPGR